MISSLYKRKLVIYFLFYNSENNGEAENWINQLVASEDILSLIIKGLDKFTEYEIYVQAFNSKGRSPNSTLIVAVTREDGKFLQLIKTKTTKCFCWFDPRNWVKHIN